jgi:hypothetical protein
MKTQFFSLALSIVLSGCVRSPRSPEVPIENDLSVRFPQFFEHEAIAVGAGQVPYELDGEVLRAIMIATNDLLSPSIADQPCRSRLEAQFYRVIREQNIIFVYIYENHAYCGRQYPAPDSGAKYAISTDGRILRRVIDGQLMEPLALEMPEPGDAGPPTELGSSRAFDAIWNPPRPVQRDGGLVAPPPEAHPAPSSTSDGGLQQAP